jgi:signal transduction histidine kinase
LSNVARHSGASSARVTLAGTAAEVVLRVVDDGTGFVSNGKPAGLGLISMRERVESLDGTLSITTVAGKGTVLEARVPLSSVRASVPAGEPAVPNLHS